MQIVKIQVWYERTVLLSIYYYFNIVFLPVLAAQISQSAANARCKNLTTDVTEFCVFIHLYRTFINKHRLSYN